MHEFRCGKCKRLHFKGLLFDARDVLQVRCRCGQVNIYNADSVSKRELTPDGLGGFMLTKGRPSA